MNKCHIYKGEYPKLEAHFATSHLIEGKQYKCDICDIVFDSKGKLKSHSNKTHRNHHKCNICNKIFGTYDHLRIHMQRVHENKREHKCNSCMKAFHSAILLKKHILFRLQAHS